MPTRVDATMGSMWPGLTAAIDRDPVGVAIVLDVAERLRATDERKALSPSLKEELAWIIEIESRWRPDIQNSIGATGLIQFIPSTAKGLGTTTDELKAMSLEQQAVYVEKFFQQVLGKVGPAAKQGDLYMATFYPEFYNSPPDFVIAADGGPRQKVWEQNPALRCTPAGPITPECVRAKAMPKASPPPLPNIKDFPTEQSNDYPRKKSPLPFVAIVLFLAWLMGRNQ